MPSGIRYMPPTNLTRKVNKCVTPRSLRRAASASGGGSVGRSDTVVRSITHHQPSLDAELLRELEPPRTHLEEPELLPHAVCVHTFGTDVTHKQVLAAMTSALRFVPDARVEWIQFEARNVILKTTCLPNRWIVQLNCDQAAKWLTATGMTLNSEKVKVELYDDVTRLEYEAYQAHLETEKLGVVKRRRKTKKTRRDVSGESDVTDDEAVQDFKLRR